MPDDLPEVIGKCILWEGYVNSDGYGTTHGISVHRRAWISVNGPVPEGLELDHLCNVRTCINPVHLEAVTHQENIRRLHLRRTTCANGHDASNMYMQQSGKRRCRVCRNNARRKYRRKMALLGIRV